MPAFLIARLFQAVLVMLAVGFVAFALFRFVGDPVLFMVGQDATPEDRARIVSSLGLDQPFYVQYGKYLVRALQGEFGLSLREKRPVLTLFAERLPATVELSLCATLLALLVGVPIGVFAAIKPRSVLANLLMGFSLLGVALPTFLTGIILIWVFSVTLGWLPSFGRGEVVAAGPWTTGLLTASGIRALVLPSVTLALFQMTVVVRLLRSEMLDVLQTEYIRFARARGLSERAINFGHALRNSLIPVITVAGLQMGSVFAYAIITETVFQWPGLGLLFIQSVAVSDVPVMAAYLCLVALVFVMINIVVDVLYHWIDPRLRVGASSLV